MSRNPRCPRFLRLAALATVVAACLIGYATYRQATAGVEDGPGPIAVFVGLAAILGSAINQPFRKTTLAGMVVRRRRRRTEPSGALFPLEVRGGDGLRLPALSGVHGRPAQAAACFRSSPAGDHPFASINGFVLEVNPGTNADFAKLLVWSFVAGFSEKFVPNLIAKLEGQATGRGDGAAGEDSLRDRR